MRAKIKALLQIFWTKIHADIVDLWERDKTFLLIFGVVILSIKFRDILIKLLVLDIKNLFNKSQKQNDDLQKKENDANISAEKLVQQAETLTKSDSINTDDNWYKKQ